MSFTYNPKDLKTSKLFQVRLNTGNTDEYGLVPLQDEEIEFFLTQTYGRVQDASIKSLDALINRAGTLVDKETGQTQESASQLLDNLIKARNDMLTSASRNVPIHAQLTGFFEADRKEQQDDPTIFHDGQTNISEYPDARLLNGPLIGGPGSPSGGGPSSFGSA